MPTLPLPSPQSPTKVLLTSGTGYIGQWVLRTLLDRGYTVRVAVRSGAKEQSVKDACMEEDDHGKLEFVVVEDLTKEGAMDGAVKGVSGIVHVASPLPPRSAEADPRNTIDPAVKGSLGVLNSALKHGTDLKRIVFTASFGAIFTQSTPGYGGPTPVIFSEENWNTEIVAQVEGGDRDPVNVYRASKILAEKAIWTWYTTHKPSLTWDITTLNPPLVYGPPLTPLSTPFSLPSSALYFYLFAFHPHSAEVGSAVPIPITKESLGKEEGNVWADVRDVAEAHVRALEREEAGGERVLTCAGAYTWQEWINLVQKIAPTIPGLSPSKIAAFPKGYPELTAGGLVEYAYDVDYSKEKRVLGVRYRGKEELVRDLLEHGVKGGWLV